MCEHLQRCGEHSTVKYRDCRGFASRDALSARSCLLSAPLGRCPAWPHHGRTFEHHEQPKLRYVDPFHPKSAKNVFTCACGLPFGQTLDRVVHPNLSVALRHHLTKANAHHLLCDCSTHFHLCSLTPMYSNALCISLALNSGCLCNSACIIFQ